jgi:hypothetical protein
MFICFGEVFRTVAAEMADKRADGLIRNDGPRLLGYSQLWWASTNMLAVETRLTIDELPSSQ